MPSYCTVRSSLPRSQPITKATRGSRRRFCALQEPGPAGDMAGAAGAFIAAICLTGGFTVSLLAVIVSKLLRRGAPTWLALRFLLSIVDGLVIAAVAAGKGNFQLAQIAGAVLIF